MRPPTPPAAIPAREGDDDGGRTAIATLRGLQSGAIAGPTLSTGDRRRVVEHLWAEGYSATETAEIAKVSERTILRDRAAIRQANALRPDDGFVPEMVGGLLRQAEQTIARLRRLSRDKAAAAAAKVDAEIACWTVSRELVGTLQSLGYLPSAPKLIQGELTHRVEDAPSYEDLQSELQRVGTIVAAGGDAEVLDQVGRIQDALSRIRLGSQLKTLATTAATASTQGATDEEPED